MKTVTFECSETRNEHEEEFEFEDSATEEEIEQEFLEWVWNEIGSHYSWYVKEGNGDEI